MIAPLESPFLACWSIVAVRDFSNRRAQYERKLEGLQDGMERKVANVRFCIKTSVLRSICMAIGEEAPPPEALTDEEIQGAMVELLKGQ